MTVDNIIKGCIKGNAKAQEALYLGYRDVLFRICLKYCRSHDAAEDNLHNAFIDIFTKIGQYKNAGSFEGWMKRITINKAIDSYKKTIQMVPVKDDLPDDVTVSDEDMNVSAEYILSLVQQLPDQYRLVFSLYELDDYSHKDIAALLEISEGTSKSNLHRAKALLKEKLTRKPMFNNYNVRNGQQ